MSHSPTTARPRWAGWAAGAVATTAAAAAYAARARPWLLHWGATDHEIERPWPGDDLSPEPDAEATRGVTIHAPASAVWPWIVQVGQDRAGFYSYDWLENLLGFQIQNVHRILPEFQQREEGDAVWMAPPYKFGGRARLTVARLEKDRAMVLVYPEDAERIARGDEAVRGTWAFEIEPVDDESCRLVMRTRSGRHPALRDRLAQRLFWEWADFIMERKMMLTIKQLAERDLVEAEGEEAA